MFQCSLCRDQCEEWLLYSTHCSACEQIRRIISLYSKDNVLNTLRTVYLRDEQPCENRTKKILNNKETVRKSPRIEAIKKDIPIDKTHTA